MPATDAPTGPQLSVMRRLAGGRLLRLVDMIWRTPGGEHVPSSRARKLIDRGFVESVGESEYRLTAEGERWAKGVTR